MKRKINNTRLLVLNADSPYWERWLSRVSGGIDKIKEKFGIEVDFVKSDELMKIWTEVDEDRIKWPFTSSVCSIYISQRRRHTRCM